MNVIKTLGIGIAAIALFFVMMAAFTHGNQPNLEETFEPQIPALVKRIGEWDMTTFMLIMTDDGYAKLPASSKTLFDQLKQNYGAVVSTGQPELMNHQHYAALIGTSFTTATYRVPVTFEMQQGTLRITLVAKNDEIKLQGMRLL